MKRTYLIIGALIALAIAGWICWERAKLIHQTSESAQNTEQVSSSIKFVHFEDTDQKISFEIPDDWVQRTEPMSGNPAFASSNFDLHINEGGEGDVKGAYISYYRYLPPANSEYAGKPAAYFQFLMENSSGEGYGSWSKITLDGREAYIHTTGGSNSLAVLMRDGEYIVEIRYLGQSGQYKPVFDRFLKTFKIAN